MAVVCTMKISARLSTLSHLLLLLTALLSGAAAYASNELPSAKIEPRALNYTGTFSLQQTEPNLTGLGVTIASISRSNTYLAGEPQDDYVWDISHNCFTNKNISFSERFTQPSGISEHSTATGGILVGQDPNGYHDSTGFFRYQGACPAAKVEVFEFWRFLSGFVIGDRQTNADIMTMSLGDVFEDWWTRGIENLVERNGTVIVAGIGNGSSVFDPVLYPAASANVIGVGLISSVGNGMDSRLPPAEFSVPNPQHSSSGPTTQGRCKPDLVAPGNCLVPDAEGVNSYKISGDWSSFASPVTAGTIALLVQKAKSDPNLAAATGKDGANCVIRAVVMNSATKLPYWHKGRATPDDDSVTPLDYLQGAGALNAMRAYEQLTAGPHLPGPVRQTGWDNNTISRTETAANSYQFEMPAGTSGRIAVTLVWNRHYADKYPFDSLRQADTDLRLELWATDSYDPTNEYLIDYSDSPDDNVEHIYCATDPNYISYRLTVAVGQGQSVFDPNTAERYGLAWNVTGEDSVDSRWWYDLNGDGRIDSTDALVFSVFDRFRNLLSNNSFAAEILKLNPERTALLETYWQQWRPHWSRWYTPAE